MRKLIVLATALVLAAGAAMPAFGQTVDEEEPVVSYHFDAEAGRLRRLYNDGWWNETLGRFQTAEIAGEAFDTTLIPLLQILPVYYGIVEPGPRRERLLDAMPRGKIVEVNVYLAEAFYGTGRDEAALKEARRDTQVSVGGLMSPSVSRAIIQQLQRAHPDLVDRIARAFPDPAEGCGTTGERGSRPPPTSPPRASSGRATRAETPCFITTATAPSPMWRPSWD